MTTRPDPRCAVPDCTEPPSSSAIRDRVTPPDPTHRFSMFDLCADHVVAMDGDLWDQLVDRHTEHSGVTWGPMLVVPLGSDLDPLIPGSGYQGLYPYDIDEPQEFELDARFTYHPPWGSQPARYQELRAQARELADTIVRMTPDSRERSLALTNLEQTVMWANAAIARRETRTDG